ncbi:MAG: hypothetical protein NHG13_00120 [Candidatus Shikimatogenerans bostrichidophilus]|nr:MAG: hypothetical protein NHG13_00120 [Candidatus Shikimatogenerans bostrichidophilus]
MINKKILLIYCSNKFCAFSINYKNIIFKYLFFKIKNILLILKKNIIKYNINLIFLSYKKQQKKMIKIIFLKNLILKKFPYLKIKLIKIKHFNNLANNLIDNLYSQKKTKTKKKKIILTSILILQNYLNKYK